MKSLLLFTLLCLFVGVSGQHNYIVPTTIPAEYHTNIGEAFNDFITSKKNINDTLLLREFAERTIYNKKSTLLNGNVYYNFDAFETFLNGILKKLLCATD